MKCVEYEVNFCLSHVPDSHISICPILYCKLSLTAALLTIREDYKASLQDILRYSPFKTQEELLLEVNTISSVGITGTRIIIWNLCRSVCRSQIRRCVRNVLVEK